MERSFRVQQRKFCRSSKRKASFQRPAIQDVESALHGLLGLRHLAKCHEESAASGAAQLGTPVSEDWQTVNGPSSCLSLEVLVCECNNAFLSEWSSRESPGPWSRQVATTLVWFWSDRRCLIIVFSTCSVPNTELCLANEGKNPPSGTKRTSLQKLFVSTIQLGETKTETS